MEWLLVGFWAGWVSTPQPRKLSVLTGMLQPDTSTTQIQGFFLGICRWQPHTQVCRIRHCYLAGQSRRSPAGSMKNVIVECARVYNSWVTSALQPPQITQQRKSWKEAPPWFPHSIPPLLSGAWQVKVRIKRLLKNPTYIESTYSFHWSFFPFYSKPWTGLSSSCHH